MEILKNSILFLRARRAEGHGVWYKDFLFWRFSSKASLLNFWPLTPFPKKTAACQVCLHLKTLSFGENPGLWPGGWLWPAFTYEDPGSLLPGLIPCFPHLSPDRWHSLEGHPPSGPALPSDHIPPCWALALFLGLIRLASGNPPWNFLQYFIFCPCFPHIFLASLPLNSLHFIYSMPQGQRHAVACTETLPGANVSCCHHVAFVERKKYPFFCEKVENGPQNSDLTLKCTHRKVNQK